MWRLLDIYRIPVFIFINKMDQKRNDRQSLMNELRGRLSDGCIEFGREKDKGFYDKLAMCDEDMMEAWLEKNSINTEQIQKAVRERRYFMYFWSGFKTGGFKAFMKGIAKYTINPDILRIRSKSFKIPNEQETSYIYENYRGE